MADSGEFLSYLARHFVSLGFFDQSPQVAKEYGGAGRFHSLSGFLVTVRNLVYLMTAGHALAQIEEAMQNGQKLTGWMLDDSFGWEARHREPIPFDFLGAARRHIVADGMDYGIVHLTPYFVRLLIANGVKAIGEESWEREWPTHFDAYALLGLPAQLVTPLGGVKGAVSRVMALMPVQKIDDESIVPDQLKHPSPRIYGRVTLPTDEPAFDSIVGMSGGPLFGFKYDAAGKRVGQYWVIGVQAAWDPETRIIAACPIQQMLRAISSAIDEQFAPGPQG